MLFKQVQLFKLTSPVFPSIEDLAAKLEPLLFKPCLPSMPVSVGWVPVIDEEEAPLVRAVNGCFMLCLQFEEKVLPASVIQQELLKHIKKIESEESRKIGRKQKLSLKDDIMLTLLPRAFTKLTRLYAYVDTINQWLVLGTANAKMTEQFVDVFKKTMGDVTPLREPKKLSSKMTQWLKHQDYPSSFAIEKACVLQDPNQETRMIRCQQQNLFASSIQSLLQDGCHVKQIALSWQDRINFVLAHDFSLRSIQFQDELIAAAKELEAETKQQQFDADFLIMTQSFSGLLQELTNLVLVQ